ncbi:MAG: winged helix DNA-binding domain-containing protein [Candidatus Limnocylindria bacterium]
MKARVTWRQALGWRMQRQLLDPVGRLPVAGVVRRLCGIQAQVASSAELAVRFRRESSRPGEVARALAEGRLIRTWAMRGTLHLLTPEEGGTFLSLLAAGRSWERPSWQRYFGVTPSQLDLLRRTVRDALDGTLLTREELVTAVTKQRGLGHVGEALRSGWGTLLKPLAWQGDLCFGPSRGNHATFMLPETASARWGGVPDPDEAALVVITAYLRAYGPATLVNFHNWLSRGRISSRRIRTWFGALSDRLAEIEVEGERAYVLAEDVDELTSARASTAVRLLPGFDQYVLGAGTEDVNVVPSRRRSAVSKQSGWISPIVVAAGVVSGTWELEDDRASIAWFREAGRPPRDALEAECARLSAILDRDVRAAIGVV